MKSLFRLLTILSQLIIYFVFIKKGVDLLSWDMILLVIGMIGIDIFSFMQECARRGDFK